MGGLSSGLTAIMVLGFAVFCFITYHKLFDVLYFNLGQGLFKEIIGCFIAGVVMTAIVCLIWWLAAIIIAIAAISAFKKGKTGTAILCVILVIIVMIVGISVKSAAG